MLLPSPRPALPSPRSARQHTGDNSGIHAAQTTYGSTTQGAYVAHALRQGGEYSYATLTKGSALTDADVEDLVSAPATSGAIALSTNAVYLLLTGAEVDQGAGFCSSYCGKNGYSSGSQQTYAWGARAPARPPAPFLRPPPLYTECVLRAPGSRPASGRTLA